MKLRAVIFLAIVASAVTLVGFVTVPLVLAIPIPGIRSVPAAFFYGLLMAIGALRLQLSFYHHLRGNAGMIGAHLPECVAALHAMVTNESIHYSFLKSMAHVQAAGYIGRRDHDAIGRALATGGEIALFFPLLIPAGFDIGGLVGFVHSACLGCPGKKGRIIACI